jgi:crotonobetainyl-CoA:carnitine CoA-transferase CaiB-like acyl-CoA transferase
MEQALTLPYATLRCVHQGWRVIKVEAAPRPGQERVGDPNRYIGRPVAGKDRHSYFISPNLGKEAIAIDLKQEEGRELLKRLIKQLNVDIFCTNTMPARHGKLGIDYDTLTGVKEDLIWCSISAMGLKYPGVPGYDPAMQALCGYMDITGHGDGPPLQSGLPISDLKAGDDAFTQIILALMERMQTGKGKKIDISMAQSAVSWLHTFLPMLDMGSPPEELKRSGNQHRQFIPVNAYKTADGYIYIVIGSDHQWKRFTGIPMFAPLDLEQYTSNEGRRKHQEELFAGIETITLSHPSAEISKVLEEATIPYSPITPIEEVADLPFVKETALSTATPDGQKVRIPPPAQTTGFLEECGGNLPFAPAYGEHTVSLLEEAGLSSARIAALKEQGIIA